MKTARSVSKYIAQRLKTPDKIVEFPVCPFSILEKCMNSLTSLLENNGIVFAKYEFKQIKISKLKNLNLN